MSDRPIDTCFTWQVDEECFTTKLDTKSMVLGDGRRIKPTCLLELSRAGFPAVVPKHAQIKPHKSPVSREDTHPGSIVRVYVLLKTPSSCYDELHQMAQVAGAISSSALQWSKRVSAAGNAEEGWTRNLGTETNNFQGHVENAKIITEKRTS